MMKKNNQIPGRARGEIAVKSKNKLAAKARIEDISKREKQVLTKVANGLTSVEIANELFICVDTVETHRKNILKKFGVSNSIEAVALAIRNKIID
jgi:DNA-binding NarL/FixJ family response regulator